MYKYTQMRLFKYTEHL